MGTARKSSWYLQILSLCRQTLLQFHLGHAFDFHDFHAPGFPGHDSYSRPRHSRQVREEPYALLVGFPVDGRRGYIEFVGFPETAGDPGSLRARMHSYRDARHKILARRFATPAATRWSTTSKLMASSSQSWLVPSAFWLATVRV